MNAIVQIKSLLFSFLYGMLFSYLTSINYKYLFNKQYLIKISFTIIFILDICLLYLYLLLKLNGGYIHIYFIMCASLGFLFSHKKLQVLIKRISTNKLFEKIIRKWYTVFTIGWIGYGKKKSFKKG